jgi:hypothetical protein
MKEKPTKIIIDFNKNKWVLFTNKNTYSNEEVMSLNNHLDEIDLLLKIISEHLIETLKQINNK